MHRRDTCSVRSTTDSPAESFQVSTPSAFSKLNLHTSFSPLMFSQGSCSSRFVSFTKTCTMSSILQIFFSMQLNSAATHLSFRSASPCLSNRSSPLSVPSRSPCPDSQPEPFSDGADIQVANLDYRMSRKELQQILLDTFAKHGRVREPVTPYLSS